MHIDEQTGIQYYSPKVFERIKDVFDSMGYLMVIGLSLAMWWGIFELVSMLISASDITSNVSDSIPAGTSPDI